VKRCCLLTDTVDGRWRIREALLSVDRYCSWSVKDTWSRTCVLHAVTRPRLYNDCCLTVSSLMSKNAHFFVTYAHFLSACVVTLSYF